MPQAPERLEAHYTALGRQGRFLQASGAETWPDGTVTVCYQFIHALYHEMVYARVSAGHRVRLHQRIGALKEAGYGAQARQNVAQLAVHFTRGHDAWRAATSLSPLWQHQRKWAAAYNLLAVVYGWFTEAFDIADLEEAKALLEAFGK